MKNHLRLTILWNVFSFLVLVLIVACSSPAVQPTAQLSNPVPVNGAVLSSNNFTLSWSYSAGSKRQSTEYLVFLGISVEALTTGIPASEPSLTVANLPAGEYFWKVQATTNGQSVFSDIWGFTIAADTLPQIEDLDNTVVEPELLVSNVEANSLTLEWPKYTDPSNPENPMSYIVELTQASNTITGRQHVETAATGTTFFSLVSGQAYEFEIIAKVLNGNTCVVGHGKTETNNHAPSAPTILTPLNNAEEQPLSLLLGWSASTDPDGDELHYGVYVGTHPSDLVRKTSEHGIEETQYTVTVEEGKTYYWQVVVKDGKGGINTSEKYSFSTISPLPKPHNPNPADHSFDINPNQPLTLTWECAPNLVYDVYVGKNTPHLELEAANLTQTQYVLGAGSLEEQKRYYWQVVVKESVSAVPSFDGRLTNLVQSITQRDGDTDGTVWDFKTGKGDTVSYSITVQSSPTSGGDIRVNSGLWGDTKSATVTVGATVTVEASAVLGYVFDGWYKGTQKVSSNVTYTLTVTENQTLVAYFSLIDYSAPVIQLKTPANGITGVATTVTFTWEATPGNQAGTFPRAVVITNYTLFLAEHGQSYGQGQIVTQKSTTTKVDYGKTYQWSVVANQSNGKSATSTEWNFTTVGTPCTITVQSSPTSGGDVRINGGGWVDNQSVTVTAGATVMVEASAAAGYVFDGWYDGTTRIATTMQYTFILTADKAFKANFVQVTFFMGNTRGDPEGDSNELPVHGVLFTYNFYIGTYEVTFDEYDAYCTAMSKTLPYDWGWGRGTRPVIEVSWFDAIAYCNWLSQKEGIAVAYRLEGETDAGSLLDANGNITTDITKVPGWRLPTEAEWEYAARGGSIDIKDGVEANDFKYSGSDNLDEVGWYAENSGGKTQPVGLKKANELGVYDMSGNVREWCHDRIGSYSSAAQTNPTGPISGSCRLGRGGSWGNGARGCRSANRDGGYYGLPSFTHYNLGFRLARTVY